MANKFVTLIKVANKTSIIFFFINLYLLYKLTNIHTKNVETKK